MVDIARELEQRGLFVYQNSHETASVVFQQPIEQYIQSYHARNGLSLDRMDAKAAKQFDAEMRTALQPFAVQAESNCKFLRRLSGDDLWM